MAALAYRNSDDERADKAQQERLLAALDAWDRALRRDENAAWIIRGRHGAITTRSDLQRPAWAVYAQPVSTVDPLTVTQDGDSEGAFRLDRLPAADEAVLSAWRQALAFARLVRFGVAAAVACSAAAG